jgi:hypothetical protein
MEDNGDIAMWIVAWGEAVWLCVVVATCGEKVRCVYEAICMASYASSPENPMAGLSVDAQPTSNMLPPESKGDWAQCMGGPSPACYKNTIQPGIPSCRLCRQ